MNVEHIPVLLREVTEMLRPEQDGIYVDATIGPGGHAEGILQCAGNCTLIGIDRDEKAIERAKERLKNYRNIHLIRDSFSNIKAAVNSLGYDRVNGILLDLGVSALHLKSEGRGFSFLKDEALDMRMDQRQSFTAEDVINRYPEKDLATVIWQYGEERFSRKIAKAIVNARRRERIRSCMELAGIIEKAIRRRGRIHPATRTFQALRIEVNKELEELPAAIDAGAGLLAPEGRFCVISYHSLEDRIVKNAFKKLAKDGLFNIITKKPLVPGREEQQLNPSSRSAKLRVGEKI
ncbi:MAG TPA: 16S rRNA (cytosine(1402)-N(4))-methyltransferase RsmH [Nitrospirae bacterium]|nr:ribosomal RNA small subunit methyltransferase H [bacterium BMS3Abin06]HDH12451.1 16S rRNA (cytosine(1402)-N(4))-methyltransferase RsmH [Nitrospirota bacterium]HDZ02412.1 16S rRNA (cytosine(1402)-N(4))-methyltransferase RsmH [Nitrospirota bacterium]